MNHVWIVQTIGSGDILGVYSSWEASYAHLEEIWECMEDVGVITYDELRSATLWEDDEGTLVAAYKIDNHIVEGTK